MSLQGYTLAESAFSLNRGPQNIDPDTSSSQVIPVLYNVEIPTGTAERSYVNGSTSVTIIDPNGEGTCKPRLVATSSFSFKILNDLNATAGAPFTSETASQDDIESLLNFFATLTYTVPAPAALAIV